MRPKIFFAVISLAASIALPAATAPKAEAGSINFRAQLQGGVQTIPFSLNGFDPATQISAQGTSNLGPINSQAIEEADFSNTVTCSAGQLGFSTGGGSFITNFSNGDRLYTQLTSLTECCVLNPNFSTSTPVPPALPPPLFSTCSYTEQATVVGGTGCFNGATGTLNGSGTVQFLSGLTPSTAFGLSGSAAFALFGSGGESVNGTISTANPCPLVQNQQ